jgi:hypothetical protein
LPAEVKVTGSVTAVFTATSPNAKLLEEMLSMRVSASTCRVILFETLPALAVSVTVWLVVTHCEVTVNAALVSPDVTVTVAGRVNDALLLDKLTTSPALGASTVSFTVQAFVSCPTKDALLQVSPFSAAAEEDDGVPVPPR